MFGRDESLDRAAAQVRDRCWSAWCRGPLVSLGNRGGFSGARLWQVAGETGRFCLRAWPPHMSAASVDRLHRLTQHARSQRLAFVPAVYPASDGATVVDVAERVWELTQWLPGKADYAEHPSLARLETACDALARLHCAWAAFPTPAEVCPAVQRRLRVLDEWHALVSGGWQPRPRADVVDPVWSVAERAWRGLPGWVEEVTSSLRPWAGFLCRVQPCLCDLWHDHLLYEGDRLTGLVDYGAVKPDHVAVDLARMLGSLVGDDPEGWHRGLRAYRRIGSLDGNDEALARVLDRTGTILGVVNWLQWLYHEGRQYEDLAAVARRLEGLLNRIEGMKGSPIAR
jgi:homoserine kinase type II